MSKIVLIIAGFIIASAFSHPAAEESHNIAGEKEHREAVVNIHGHDRHEGEVKEIQVKEKINIEKTEVLHPTIKCAEIEPDVGHAGPENHEACLAHCVQLEREYRHGKCLKGICHCGMERKEVVEVGKLHEENGKGHPTVRCEHIIPNSGAAGPVNHEACIAHCSSLSHEFASGECFEGVCHCRKVEKTPIPHPPVIASETVQPSIQSHGRREEGIFRHPTVKCEHLVPFKGTPSAESHELCIVHCRSLGSEYTHGECVQGVCHCERQRQHGTHEPREESVEGHPTVRCEHIHPITGNPGPENHEACSSHCHTIAELYLEGRCVAGICRCQMGTVVKAVPPVPRSPHGLHSTGIKCEEIEVPGVAAYSENHQACLTHCHTLDKSYREGQCHQGICHCQQ